MNEQDKKAQELYDFYFPLVEAFSVEGQHENAKKCAINTVDKIIESDPSHPRFTTGEEWETGFLTIDRANIDPLKYWNAVKESLNKL